MAYKDKRMVFTEHLKELRSRLIISTVAVAIGFAVSYNFSKELYDVLTRPLLPTLPEGVRFMVFTGVAEPFFIYLKIGILAGIILASPVIIYETWAFVAPGLYEHERKWLVPVVIGSVILFIVGIAFAYFVVLPFAFTYLMSYATDELRPVLSMSLYFSMATKFILAFGAVFQLPLVILVLSRFGLVTAEQLVRWWRYALVVVLIVAAILTPPDVFSQCLMAGPLMVLYGIGIVLAKFFGKKKEELKEIVAEEDLSKD